jgi:small subunit ribosomal protein S9
MLLVAVLRVRPTAMLGISLYPEMNLEYRPALKAAGLLKRDPRSVERKKLVIRKQ